MHAAITYYFKKQIFYMNRAFPDANYSLPYFGPRGALGELNLSYVKAFWLLRAFGNGFVLRKVVLIKADFLIWLVFRARESESCRFRLATEWAFFHPLGMIHFFPTREISFLHNKLFIDHGRTGEEGLILNTCVSVVFCLWSWLRVG